MSEEIILLWDFNTDLLKPNKSWLQKLENYNLYQLISTLTRVTATSKTLIDHIYVSNKFHVIETCVPVFSCSDHFPVCLTLLKKGMKSPRQRIEVVFPNLMMTFFFLVGQIPPFRIYTTSVSKMPLYSIGMRPSSVSKTRMLSLKPYR